MADRTGIRPLTPRRGRGCAAQWPAEAHDPKGFGVRVSPAPPKVAYNARMGDVIHTSRIRIYQDQPPERRAFVEGFDEPLEFGVHGGIKHFYRMEPRRDLPATLDHMVAAVGG